MPTSETIQEDTYIAFVFKTKTVHGESSNVLQYQALSSSRLSDVPDVLLNESSVYPGTIVTRLYNFYAETVGFQFVGFTEPTGSQDIRRQFVVSETCPLGISCDETVTLQPRPTRTNGRLIEFQLGDGSQPFEIVSASGTLTAELDDGRPVTSISANTSISKLVLTDYDGTTQLEIQMAGSRAADRLEHDQSIVVCNKADYGQYVGIKTSAPEDKVRLWIGADQSYSVDFGLPLPSATDDPLELTFVIYDTSGDKIHGDPTFKTYNANSSIKS